MLESRNAMIKTAYAVVPLDKCEKKSRPNATFKVIMPLADAEDFPIVLFSDEIFQNDKLWGGPKGGNQNKRKETRF